MRTYENFDLTNYNSYRIKATCRRAYFPDSEADVAEFYSVSQSPKILLGSGHNVILSKSYYEEDFLIFNGNFNTIYVDNDLLEVEAGATMFEVSDTALQHRLSGVEIFFDIPSSLGGAIVMNAGASGEEIKDVLQKVRYLDLSDYEIKEIENQAMQFEYRNSFFQRNTDKIVLKAWLQLKNADFEVIRSKMDSIKAARDAKSNRRNFRMQEVYSRGQRAFMSVR